jgi:hypothetical protein
MVYVFIYAYIRNEKWLLIAIEDNHRGRSHDMDDFDLRVLQELTEGGSDGIWADATLAVREKQTRF